MASAALSPYYDNASQITYSLVSTSKDSSLYRVSGRSLATPHTLEIIRKIGPNGAAANDHVIVRLTRVERNETTQKLATVSCSLDISIPRDTTAVTNSTVIAQLGALASLLNDSTALAATANNRGALIDGRDL